MDFILKNKPRDTLYKCMLSFNLLHPYSYSFSMLLCNFPLCAIIIIIYGSNNKSSHCKLFLKKVVLRIISFKESRNKRNVQLQCLASHRHIRKFSQRIQTYKNIYRSIQRELFTKILDRVFPYLVKEFYSNLKIEDLSHESSVKRTKISIH